MKKTLDKSGKLCYTVVTKGKEKEIKKMYFVMTVKDETTIVMSKFEDIAMMIARNFTEECVVRKVVDDKYTAVTKNFFK